MRNLNVIPLSALRAIEAVARNGTLALAADELGVTSGALSQRLAKAEELLERKLFNRGSGGLVPTMECAKVIPQLSRAMGELSAVVSELASDDQSILTVTVAPIFASRWLIWRIHKFNQLHPDISVRIEPRVEVVDLDYSEVDIGIRVGSDPEMGNGAIKLLDQRVFPVCSPELAEKVEDLDDLLRLPVIRENERLYGWSTWLSERGIEDYELTEGPTYADASLCLDAAMTGQGVFMAWETLACDGLERGQVVAPFSQRSVTGATYWFSIRNRSRKRASVNIFQAWLQDELDCSAKYWEQSRHKDSAID